MAIHLRAERRIAASPEAVYALAIDAQRFPAVFTGCGPIPGLRRITLHGEPAVGTTRDVEDNAGVVMHERIDALEPGRRHAYTLSRLKPPFAWLVRVGHADWTFTPSGNATDVVFSYEFELTSALAWPLAAPLLGVFMRGAMQRCLDGMARVLESGAPR